MFCPNNSAGPTLVSVGYYSTPISAPGVYACSPVIPVCTQVCLFPLTPQPTPDMVSSSVRRGTTVSMGLWCVSSSLSLPPCPSPVLSLPPLPQSACAPGTWSNAFGLTALCTALCDAGYYCTAGSVSPEPVTCGEPPTRRHPPQHPALLRFPSHAHMHPQARRIITAPPALAPPYPYSRATTALVARVTLQGMQRR